MRRRINETENSITFTGIESYYYYYVQNIILFFVYILFQDLLDRNIFIHFCAMRGKKKTGGEREGGGGIEQIYTMKSRVETFLRPRIITRRLYLAITRDIETRRLKRLRD